MTLITIIISFFIGISNNLNYNNTTNDNSAKTFAQIKPDEFQMI